jgi:hypothetical protein
VCGGHDSERLRDVGGENERDRANGRRENVCMCVYVRVCVCGRQKTERRKSSGYKKQQQNTHTHTHIQTNTTHTYTHKHAKKRRKTSSEQRGRKPNLVMCVRQHFLEHAYEEHFPLEGWWLTNEQVKRSTSTVLGSEERIGILGQEDQTHLQVLSLTGQVQRSPSGLVTHIHLQRRATMENRATDATCNAKERNNEG